MTGAIEYLTRLQQICEMNKRDCKKCKLGKQQKLYETLCPRLTNPREWDRDRIAKMVRKSGNN
jgi:hypothetical protein